MFEILGKRVMVAGATGFLGGWVSRELISHGAVVTGVSLHGSHSHGTNALTQKVDLRDPDSAIDILSGNDALVIASAVTSGAKIMNSTPLVHLLDNILINGSLLRAALRLGTRRVVFISSSTVYPNKGIAMREDDFDGTYFEKYEVVATMKRASEEFGRLVSCHSDTQVITVRPGNAYGPHDHFSSESGHVIPSLVRKVASATNSLEVWGDGTDIKNFIYAQDLAQGIVQALKHGEGGRTYNLGGPEESSISTIVQILLDVAGKKNCKILYDASQPSMIPVRRLDSGRAALELGFSPQTSIQEGLALTYNWYMSNVNDNR